MKKKPESSLQIVLQRARDVGGFLIHPIAIGIYLTFFWTNTARVYYDYRKHLKDLKSATTLLKSLHVADLKSIDFRLQSLGPRPPSPDIALLAVDERSVQTVGRWPWPREILGKVVDNTFKNGAKVIGFDIVFSEPTDNKALLLAQRLQEKKILAGDSSGLTEELREFDSDARMSEIFAKHSDKIVAGSFHNMTQNFDRNPQAELCQDWVFKLTPAFQIWDKEESRVGPLDSARPFVPKFLEDVYRTILVNMAENYRESHPAPKNFVETYDLELAIQNQQMAYCLRWLDPKEDENYATLSEQWPAILESDPSIKYAKFEDWVQVIRSQSLPSSITNADHWVLFTPAVGSSLKHTGYFNAYQDIDGTIRRSRLVVRTGGEWYMPSLSLKTFLLAKNLNVQVKIDKDPEDKERKILTELQLLDSDTGNPVQNIPVDEEGNLLINYMGPQMMFPHISASDMLTDSPKMKVSWRRYDPTKKIWIVDPEVEVDKAAFLKNKILLVGATAVGIYDLRVTPFEENFPGAETHLNVLDNLLRNNFMYLHPNEMILMLISLLTIGLILSFALAKVGALWGLGISSGMLFCLYFLDRIVFFQNGILVSIIFPIGLTLIIYVGLTFFKYLTEERNKKELRQTFQKYVSPAIVNEILSDPKHVELGGRKEKITVFFSDVRGFTTISERLDPRALVDLLNTYLTPMTDLVFKNRGTLDKYMGDAIMAFFGAPIKDVHHAENAARCALQHIEKLLELQREFAAKGLPLIDIGIGLNTGEASVGNMGSSTVRSYTVMGDTVNLGSRLEGINKEYGTRIIISEFTYDEIKSKFVCREVDWVRVKGKLQPVKIFELMSEGPPSDDQARFLNAFEQGYQSYHERKFAEGLESFQRALDLRPDDECSKLYVERCQDYMKENPPPDWDGVYTMKTK